MMAALGALLAGSLLTGCGAPAAESRPGTGVAQTTRPGFPDGVDVGPLTDGPVAVWLERSASFAIVTWGSGSCPPVSSALTVKGADHLAITFARSPNDPCTADLAPTTHEFALPDGVTTTPITIEIGYEDWPEVDTLVLP